MGVTDLSIMGCGAAAAAPPAGHFFEDYGSCIHGVDVNTASLWQETTADTAAASNGDTIERIDDEIGSKNWQEDGATAGELQTPTAFGSKRVVSNINGGIYELDSARSALSAGTVCLVGRLTDGTTSIGNNEVFWTGGSNVNSIRYRTQTGDDFFQYLRNQAGGIQDIDKAGDYMEGFPVFVLVIRWSSSSNMDVHYRIDGGTNQGPFNFDPDDSCTTNTAFTIQADQTQWAGWALYDEDIGATEAGNLLTDAIARWT